MPDSPVSMTLANSNWFIESASGFRIPGPGLGTFDTQGSGDGRCMRAVKAGILAGYRHIDTAALYGCEGEVGEGIRASGAPREELFVCTKFWQHCHAPDDVVRSLEESLDRLQLEYVDLYLMHWPLAFKRTEEYETLTGPDGKPVIDQELSENHEPTWRAMEQLVRSGKTRGIGVSNFTIPQLETLLSFAEIKPVCNQVEAHPWLPQTELLEYCKGQGIVLVAYSPLGTQPGGWHTRDAILLDDDDVVEVAKRNRVEPAQVLIAWALQRGTIPIPKSSTPSRIASNINVSRLSMEDLRRIEEICVRNPGKRNRFANFDERWGTSQFSNDP